MDVSEPSVSPEPRPADAPSPSRARTWGALLLVVGLAVLVRQSGLLAHISVDGIQQGVARMGPWGPVAFMLLAAAGVSVGIPGLLFIPGGVVAFGPVMGASLSWLGLLLGCTIAVFWVQKVGGFQAGADDKQGRIQRAMRLARERPVVGVLVVRFLLFASPPANAALALAGVPVAKNVVGTAVGIIPWVVFFTVTTDVVTGG